jgi:hypothetical protein
MLIVLKFGQQVGGRTKGKALRNRRPFMGASQGLALIATQSETETLVTYRKQRGGLLSNRYTPRTRPKARR